MKFKPFTIKNLKIATYFSEGNNMPVIFIHSNSIGAASFYKQMMSNEGKKYQFISIDIPGHGASDFSFNPARYYTFEEISKLLVETIKELNINECILCGHFTGAHLALNIASKIRKIKGLILLGFSPLEKYHNFYQAYNEIKYIELFSEPELDTEKAAKLAQVYVSKENAANISFVDNIKNTDPYFRYFFQPSLKNVNINDFEIIKNSTIPIAVITGKNDKIVNYENIKNIENYFWRKKLITISQSGNSVMWENSRTFNYLINNFIQDLTNKPNI